MNLPGYLPRPSVVRLMLLGLILLIGLGLRLYRVNEPPTDYHCWRQTQTLMVAHGFYERDFNLFHPRVYWRNTVDKPVEKEGLVGGTELQVTPWLTAMLYHVLGTGWWVDRLVPILFSLLGLVFFFLFVENMLGLPAAAAATALLCVSPMYLFFGRVQMPESFALAASFASLYYFEAWLRRGGKRSFVGSVAAAILMLLGKPTMAFMALPMFFLVVHYLGWRLVREWRLYSMAAIVLSVFLVYSWYSFSVLARASGLMFYAPGLVDRAMLGSREFYERLWESIWNRAVGWPLLLLALPAFLLPLRKRDFFPHLCVLAVLLFMGFAAKGNFKNDYYQLVLAPPAAYLAGQGVQRLLWRGHLKWLVAPLVLAAAWYSLPLAQPMYSDPVGENFKRAGDWVRENTPPETLVLSSHPNPTALYFADRTGWTCWYEAEGDIPFEGPTIAMARERGASVLMVPDGDKLDDTFFPNYLNTRDYLYEHYYCARGDNFAVFFMDHPADLSLPPDGRIVFGTLDSRKYLRGRWGKNYFAETQQATYTDLRYNKTGSLRFALPPGASSIALSVSSPVAGNVISFALDGGAKVQKEFPQAWAISEVTVPIPEAVAPDGLHTLAIEVTRQKDALVGMLLWDMLVQ